LRYLQKYGKILGMSTMQNNPQTPLPKVFVPIKKHIELATKYTSLENNYTSLENNYTSLENQHKQVREELDWLKRQLFGKKSERVISGTIGVQLEFEGFETQPQLPEEKQKVLPHERKKPKRNGQDTITLSPNTPVETTVLDIPEEEKICKETGSPLVKIGEEISHKLAHRPGSYYIKEIIRPKYAHPQTPEKGITIRELPETLLRGRADDSLLAELVTKKFVDHMPLYRCAEEMGRNGIHISRKLLSQWVVRTGLALKPLFEEMKEKILQGESVYIDETPVKLQAKKKCKTAYIWVIVGGKGANPAYRVYDFRENRQHGNAKEILKGYQGVVHSDKYGAYETLAREKIITWSPCYSHIRRKFFEAESGDPKFREWVLRKIRYLFMLEKVAWARSEEERLRIRKEKEIPIIDELIKEIQEKLKNGNHLPKSKFRKALCYFCGLKPYLKNYTKHANARLDNNVAERAIRPVAIGRKNWLFFGSTKAGEAGTILLSH